MVGERREGLVKSPRIHLSDTGLVCHLLGLGPARMARQPPWFGPLLETFVTLELRKQIAWSRARPALSHFRTQAGQEVDLVLEDARGRVVGIEVKAGTTVRAEDFRGLRVLAEASRSRFVRGVVLYGGVEPLGFGPRLLALPIDVAAGNLTRDSPIRRCRPAGERSGLDSITGCGAGVGHDAKVRESAQLREQLVVGQGLERPAPRCGP